MPSTPLSIFLDTSVIEAIEDKKIQAMLDTASKYFYVITSYSVLGEYYAESILGSDSKLNRVEEVAKILKKKNVQVVSPDRLSKKCSCTMHDWFDEIGVTDADPSYGTHLSYAVRNGCTYYILKGEKPCEIESIGYCQDNKDCSIEYTTKASVSYDCNPKIAIMTIDELNEILKKKG